MKIIIIIICLLLLVSSLLFVITIITIHGDVISISVFLIIKYIIILNTFTKYFFYNL